MNRRFLILMTLFSLSAQTVFSNESLYTSLSDKECKVIQQAEEGEGEWVTKECSGVLGYKLLKITDDDRDSLTLLYGNEKQPLNLWDYHITRHFNELGEKVEWRVSGGKAIGLIALLSFTDPESKKIEQRLIVVKVRPSKSCVIQVLDASQSVQARTAADKAPSTHCLSTSVR